MRYEIKKDWLETRYLTDLAMVEEIAGEAGCSVANIKRLLKKWSIRRGKALQKEGVIPAWNKGLTKRDDERLMKMASDRIGDANPMANKQPWNKGLTKETDERVAEISRKLTGIPKSEEHRERMSEAKLGLKGRWANNWKGGQTYASGYGALRSSVDGVREYIHRRIASAALGRPLIEDEHVHHIDRNKNNNDPKNLIVIKSVDHNRLHRAIEKGHESPEQQREWLKQNGIKYLEVAIED